MIASGVATSAGVAIGGAEVWANAAPAKRNAGSASATILSRSSVRSTVASVSRGSAPSRLAHDSTATIHPDEPAEQQLVIELELARHDAEQFVDQGADGRSG